MLAQESIIPIQDEIIAKSHLSSYKIKELFTEALSEKDNEKDPKKLVQKFSQLLGSLNFFESRRTSKRMSGIKFETIVWNQYHKFAGKKYPIELGQITLTLTLKNGEFSKILSGRIIDLSEDEKNRVNEAIVFKKINLG